jgi:anti-anti-sigma factor
MDSQYELDQAAAGARETQMLPPVGLDGIPDALAITSRRADDVLTIGLSGELDAGNVTLLDQAIREAEEGDSETILLDLRELRFIDSMGLGVLLEARHRSDRIRLLRSDHDQVARVIALTGTDEVLGYPAGD